MKYLILLLIITFSMSLSGSIVELLNEDCYDIRGWDVWEHSNNEHPDPWQNYGPFSGGSLVNSSGDFFLWIDGYQPSDYGPYFTNASLDSPSMNCTNYNKVMLSFIHYFNLGGYEMDSAEINVNLDTNIMRFSSDSPNGEFVNLDLSSYAAGNNNAHFQLTFFSPCDWTNGYGSWYIDNIVVTGYAIDDYSGTALELDGDEDYIEIPNEEDYDFTNAMTVEAWIKVDEFDKNWQAIVTKGDNSWRLQRNHNHNTIEFAAGGVSIYSTTEVNDSKWHHIAAIHSDPITLLMIDGKVEAISGIASTTEQNDYPVLIGENAQIPGRQFEGQIDEVRIWSSLRSFKQILENMHHPIDPDVPGLVSYWQFNETSEIAVDAISMNHGVASGGIRTDSSIPFGAGVSELFTVETPGNYSLLNDTVQFDFITISDTPYSPQFMITRIDNSPNINPNGYDIFSDQYWILNQYVDDASTYTADIKLVLDQNLTGEVLEEIELLTRSITSHQSWSYLQNASDIIAPNTILFDNISSLGQLLVGKQIILPVVENIQVDIMGDLCYITWDSVNSASTYKVYSSSNPESGFTEIASGVSGTTWNEPASAFKKYYFVTASTDAP